MRSERRRRLGVEQRSLPLSTGLTDEKRTQMTMRLRDSLGRGSRRWASLFLAAPLIACGAADEELSELEDVGPPVESVELPIRDATPVPEGQLLAMVLVSSS